MSGDDIPTAVWKGELIICGFHIRCAVLDDGRRVLNADDIYDFLNTDHFPTHEEAHSIARFIRGFDGITNFTR
jgi:hypothetical protein